jgi:1-acyl-sn-glycerol-3-phosphate acyltransferase
VGALRKAVSLLKQGKAVLMFPEGTRSLSGKLLKPKPGVGMIASLTSSPVVPAYVSGTNRLGDAFLRRDRLRVAFGRPVVPNGSDAVGRREDYGRLTSEVMRRIAELAEKTGQESEDNG